MNNTIKALIFLQCTYILVVVTIYSSFLTTPLLLNTNVPLKSIIDNFLLWLPSFIGLFFLFNAITSQPYKNDLIIREERFFIPALILFFLSGFSLGIHGAAQVIKDTLVDITSASFTLSHILDEYLGHVFLIFSVILIYILVLLELNRTYTRIHTRKEKLILVTMGIIGGIGGGIGGVEGGSIHIITIPILVSLNAHLIATLRQHKISISHYPMVLYFLTTSGVSLLFTIIWITTHGIFTQPSTLQINVFNF